MRDRQDGPARLPHYFGARIADIDAADSFAAIQRHDNQVDIAIFCKPDDGITWVHVPVEQPFDADFIRHRMEFPEVWQPLPQLAFQFRFIQFRHILDVQRSLVPPRDGKRIGQGDVAG